MQPKTLMALLLFASTAAGWQVQAQQTVVMDPDDIQFSPHRHDELPPQMLARIRATTDTFESIDGISYEQAVDLYKRDLDPEANLVLWEEMARAYGAFCRERCSTPAERKDVYHSLLLRTMFPEEEALARVELTVLRPAESKEAMQLYRLPPKPLEVVQGH